MQKISKQKTITETVYEAIDGEIFFTEKECEKYEEKIKENKRKKEFKEKIQKYIYDDNGRCPINFDAGCFSDLSTYTWLKVENKEEFEKMNDILGNELKEPKFYPYYWCVENEYNTEFEGLTNYVDDFDSCIKQTKLFFKKFGYEVEIKKGN